ncbi:MAG: family 43 glycosylhydrolase [Bacteroidales bacterium]
MILSLGFFLFVLAGLKAQQPDTYCNPLDLDYTYMIYNSHQDRSYRSGADPAVVEFRGEYYMFVTRSMGYWHSTDLTHWRFIEPVNWYFEGSNAPAAFNYKDSLLYVAGHPSGSMSVLYSDDPAGGRWKAVPGILYDLQDPCLFIDDDGQAYMYWGSSNLYPIRGRKLDRNKRFRPDPQITELINLDESRHGWERFGENHTDTLEGYIEGSWMSKHGDTYYLHYGAPGTEFNVYADGVYTSTSPLGPFVYAPNNPVVYKPGGFANGAGHGSLVEGPGEQSWYFGTAALGLNVNWERRINMFPVRFDTNGLLACNTAYGDYPHYAPSVPGRAGEHTGWMLLSYQKEVTSSTAVEGFGPEQAVDERIKSYWLAGANDGDQWLRVDLGLESWVHAVQINFQDHKSDYYGRIPGLHHRYVVEASTDGTNWEVVADRSDSDLDTPNAYLALEKAVRTRYLRYRNIHVPTPHLAISGFRVFGLGTGKTPGRVEGLSVDRSADPRDVMIRWKPRKGAQGYTVRWGIAPDKLYNSWQVYGEDFLDLKALTVGQSYWFAVEAFNENGIGTLSETVACP